MNLSCVISPLLGILMLAGPDLTAQENPRAIPIVASKFAFEPAEVRLKQGEAVVLVLTTQDVAHGLKSKALGFDTRIPPGQETKVALTPQKAGRFEASCSKFCGGGHFGMKMAFIVE